MKKECNCELCKERRRSAEEIHKRAQKAFMDNWIPGMEKLADVIKNAPSIQISKLMKDIEEMPPSGVGVLNFPGLYITDEPAGPKFEDFKVYPDTTGTWSEGQGVVFGKLGKGEMYTYSSEPVQVWEQRIAEKDHEILKLREELKRKDMTILAYKAALKGVLGE